jgi:hypothetical protein
VSRIAEYQSFLARKAATSESCGFTVAPDAVNPALAPITRLVVPWLLEGGRRALFASFGLHKTATQIEVMRLIGQRCSGHRLIVLPLGVRQEFDADARSYFTGEHAVALKFIQRDEDIDDPSHIYLTNYETVREGKIDVARLNAISLDEADVLRSFGSKTFGEMLFGPIQRVPLRFMATATPSPNDYLELIAYAHFLGAMDMGEAKTRFFKRDSEHADRLTLLPHKEEEFWLWVASWALFVQAPSDLGLCDDGYVLPELDVRWHEIPSNHATAEPTSRGQGRLLKDTAMGVSEASREKRESIPGRLAKLQEIRAEDPDAHRLIWHDLEAERHALEEAIPGIATVYGSQDWPSREAAMLSFRDGQIKELAAKPVMLGGGVNFQRHCHWSVFLGIGHKFRDFIQAIHRLQRFGQTQRVRVDLIYTEAEQQVRANLERKWAQDKRQRLVMREIVQRYGLATGAIETALQRSFTIDRDFREGEDWAVVNDDSVIYTADLASDGQQMILTSIPFSTQYEYTPHYADLGHTDDDDHFFEQMDFLTPELLRVTEPGRVAAIHVKDRVVPGALTGLGYQTVSPFAARTLMHFLGHGWTYLGMITVVTDVVRENAQTYRLSWSEQCKDGTRMGCGMPEYVLLFRKAPTDSSNGYADNPVAKSKAEYSRGRWQLDAHGFWRSSGNRLLTPEDLRGKRKEQIFKMFRAFSQDSVYDHEQCVAIAENLDAAGVLPPDFMLLQPWSHQADVWSDVTRMRSLNSRQVQRQREKHLCPLPFDIVDRLITRFTNPGEKVYDPFAGIGTVPLRAKELGRHGHGCELNPSYWADSVFYLRQAEQSKPTPSLFDLLGHTENDLEEVPA